MAGGEPGYRLARDGGTIGSEAPPGPGERGNDMDQHAGGAPTSIRDGDAGAILPRIVIGIAIAMQLVVLVPFTVASGLIAPLWAVVVLYAVWVVGAGMLAVVASSRALACPLVPAANAAVLWLAVTVGETWLGWTP